ncbi:MAG TPA: hypothetical protein VN929_16045 [Burkholderiales bacterium]|nr:hypothetical protein [Burkholderiales bacterium]
MPGASQLEAVMRYHERTKHHFNRFAPGPGQLDWANQPDPFRRYAGAPLTRLPILKADEEPHSPAYESDRERPDNGRIRGKCPGYVGAESLCQSEAEMRTSSYRASTLYKDVASRR